MRKFKYEIKWAFIFIWALLLWMLGEKIAGLHDQRIDQHAFYSSFFAVVAVGLYILAMADKRKNYYRGFMTWQEGFVFGLWMTGVIVLLTPLAQLIINSLITPDYFTNMREYSVETGQLSAEDAVSTFNLKRYIFECMVFAGIMGVITAAIAALIMRKRRPDPTQVKGTV